MGNEFSDDSLGILQDPVDRTRIRHFLRFTPGWIKHEDTRCEIWSLLLLGCRINEVDENNFVNASISRQNYQISAEDKRTILADVKRTRRNLPFFQSETAQKSVEDLLTRFCVHRECSYKQGMNELLAPFYLLRNPPLPEVLVYKLFEAFVKRYVEVFLLDDDFGCLQRAFGLFDLLLHFHLPALALHLRKSHFSPELYATPWIITLFSRNLDVHLVFRLWDVLLGVDDPNFVFFLMLILVQFQQHALLQRVEEELPEVIQDLKIEGEDHVDQMVRLAYEAQEETPTSFQQVLRSLPLQTLQARARKHAQRSVAPSSPEESTSGSDKGSTTPPPRSVHQPPIKKRTSFESPVHSGASNQGGSRSPVTITYKRVSNTEQRSQLRFEQGVYRKPVPVRRSVSGPDFFFCEAVGFVSVDTRELLRSLRPPGKTSTKSTASDHSPIQYVILDVRLDQDVNNSGAGEVARSFTLGSNFLRQADAMDKLLQNLSDTSGCHICLIDSHPAVYKSIDNNFFLNIFNPSEKLSNKPYQNSMRLASLLQHKNFPYVAILEGGFDSLLLELIREDGAVEPIILNHNPQQWIKSLRSRGHTEILTYLPPDYGKASPDYAAVEGSSTPRRQSFRAFSAHEASLTGSLSFRTQQLRSSLHSAFDVVKQDIAPSPVVAEQKSVETLADVLTNMDLYKMAMETAHNRGDKVAAGAIHRKLEATDATNTSKEEGNRHSPYFASAPVSRDPTPQGSRPQPRQDATHSISQKSLPSPTMNHRRQQSWSTSIETVCDSPKPSKAVTPPDPALQVCNSPKHGKAFTPSDTAWQAWQPESTTPKTSLTRTLLNKTKVPIEDLINEATSRGHHTVARILKQRANQK